MTDVDSFQGEPNLADPTAGEPVFARGKRADHPFAVLYQGEWETPWDGTATAVRLHARALASSGLPVLLRSFSHVVVNPDGVPEPVHTEGIPLSVKVEVGALPDTSATVLSPLIKHLVVRSAEHLQQVIYPRGIQHHELGVLHAMRKGVAGATILYTVWERDRVDTDTVKVLNRVAQVWVPCTQNATMLVASGVTAEKVHVVPHPFDPKNPLLKLAARKPYPNRRFYSIGRWEPRKGYHELLGAFLRAFKPSDGHTLTIKFSGGQWEGYPSPVESARHWAQQPEVIANGWTQQAFRDRVVLIGGKVNDDMIVKLHFQNNIYVSCSHGEAWNLGAFAARLAGNGMIYVPYGGVRDFAYCNDTTIDYVMEDVPASYRWPAGAQWAGFSERELQHCLSVTEAPTAFVPMSTFYEKFSLASVGALMRKLVMQVAESGVPDAAAYFSSREKDL
jgi:glycosyltransferase involved in cell wall biosynthesis